MKRTDRFKFAKSKKKTCYERDAAAPVLLTTRKSNHSAHNFPRWKEKARGFTRAVNTQQRKEKGQSKRSNLIMSTPTIIPDDSIDKIRERSLDIVVSCDLGALLVKTSVEYLSDDNNEIRTKTLRTWIDRSDHSMLTNYDVGGGILQLLEELVSTYGFETSRFKHVTCNICLPSLFRKIAVHARRYDRQKYYNFDEIFFNLSLNLGCNEDCGCYGVQDYTSMKFLVFGGKYACEGHLLTDDVHELAKKNEVAKAPKSDYLQKQPTLNAKQREVCVAMAAQICRLGMSVTSLNYAVSLFDRFLSKFRLEANDALQLSIACSYVACERGKRAGAYKKQPLTMEHLKNNFSKKFSAKVRVFLHKNVAFYAYWRISYLTSPQVLKLLPKIKRFIDSDIDIEPRASNFLLRCALGCSCTRWTDLTEDAFHVLIIAELSYENLAMKPSERAAGSLFIAMKKQPVQSSAVLDWTETLESITGYKKWQVVKYANKIITTAKEIDSDNFEDVIASTKLSSNKELLQGLETPFIDWWDENGKVKPIKTALKSTNKIYFGKKHWISKFKLTK